MAGATTQWSQQQSPQQPPRRGAGEHGNTCQGSAQTAPAGYHQPRGKRAAAEARARKQAPAERARENVREARRTPAVDTTPLIVIPQPSDPPNVAAKNNARRRGRRGGRRDRGDQGEASTSSMITESQDTLPLLSEQEGVPAATPLAASETTTASGTARRSSRLRRQVRNGGSSFPQPAQAWWKWKYLPSAARCHRRGKCCGSSTWSHCQNAACSPVSSTTETAEPLLLQAPPAVPALVDITRSLESSRSGAWSKRAAPRSRRNPKKHQRPKRPRARVADAPALLFRTSRW